MLQFYMIKRDKESYFIDKISNKFIGDDAAVVDGYIYSVDAFFEDTHFKREWMSPRQIGRKAMLVNISDAVAMNAKPKYCLISISIPKDMTENDIDELIDGFNSVAKEFDCQIIGGDTIGGEKLHISITIISQSKDPLYRKGLEIGDLLAFTGSIGESKRDLEKLLFGEKIAIDSKFYEPKLRASFVAKAREYIHVGMDISDGLFCDTNKLLDINKYGFKILKDINDDVGLSGEEYEMLIGFNKENKIELEKIAKSLNITLNIFAEVKNGDNRFKCYSHHF